MALIDEEVLEGEGEVGVFGKSLQKLVDVRVKGGDYIFFRFCLRF